MKCRYCHSQLFEDLIDLKFSPPSNSYLISRDIDKEIYYPLRVMFCKKCYLFQTSSNIDNNIFFNNNYAYFSSYSSFYLSQCEKLVNILIKKFNLNYNSLVIEVASNDGYLLNFFKKRKIKTIGIEPSLSVAKVAKEKGLKIINKFFNKKLSMQLRKQKYSADIILAFNVLAHVPDIDDFLKGMPNLLNKDGCIIFEFPHVLNLIKLNQFDTIYHEHYSYLSISFLNKILIKYGLKIFDVENIPSHGGSLRVYISKISSKKYKISDRVGSILDKERVNKLNNKITFKKFQNNIFKIKLDLLKLLLKLKSHKKMVIGYGAAAKGNTLINYFGISKDLLSYVVDKNKFKQGKFLPGSHIEIKDPKVIKTHKPDYIIILPWNLKKEILNELKYVKKWKCKFIVAIPKVTILK